MEIYNCKCSEVSRNCKYYGMKQKIYFGSVLIQDTRTKQVIEVPERIYKENDSITDERLKAYVLKHIHQSEKKFYKLIRLCFESAKVTGQTNY